MKDPGVFIDRLPFKEEGYKLSGAAITMFLSSGDKHGILRAVIIAVIFCANTAENRATVKYKLTNSPVRHAGFIQMLVNNTWGRVCESQLGSGVAKVVCRTLGMRTDGARVFYNKILGTPQADKVWMNGVSCTGTEASLLDCQHSYLGHGHCTYSFPQAISCGSPNATEDFQIRLVGESDTEPSRVEVSLFGEWGTICDKKFNDYAAKTVCRQLDLPYKMAKAADTGTYETGTGRIWLTNTTCQGYEPRLSSCSYAFPDNSCDHMHDIGVVCRGLPVPPASPYPRLSSARYSPGGFPLGAILGVPLGVVGFACIVGVFVVLTRTRLISSGQPVVARPVV